MAIFETPPVSYTHYLKDIVIDVVPSILSGVAPFTLGGSIAQFGAGGKDELINYKRTEDVVKLFADASGNPHFSIDPRQTGEIELSTIQTNPMNQKFQSLLSLNTLLNSAPNTGGMFNLTARYVSQIGTPFLIARYCRIKGQPESKKAIEADELKWSILVGILIANENGLNADAII